MMKRLQIILMAMGWFTTALTVRAADTGDEVVVIYNSRVPESKGVAQHYAAMRHVPAGQVLSFDLPDAEIISRADFRDRLQKPLAKALESKGLWHLENHDLPQIPGEAKRSERVVTESKIRYLALCYGVPLTIAKDPNLRDIINEKLPPNLNRNEAAVDSELACLPLMERRMTLYAGPLTNHLYNCTNRQELNPTNGILLVARLDGPTAAIARALVDKAMEAETNGLWGRAYFDERGLTDGPFKMGDVWIDNAAKLCRQLGFETIVDTNGGTFHAGFPLSQVAFYAGWYDENVSGPFAQPTVEFMPGAFAYHLQSFSAATIRSTKRQWVGPLLDRGATATMGCVDEPYLGGTPNIGLFFARFVYAGFTFGEAAYSSQSFVSWQTTVVGDPLYRPFGTGPAELFATLQKEHSKLVQWAILRSVNVKLIEGTPLEQVIAAVEAYPTVKESPVLEEKLAFLYSAQGKPSSSIHALEVALQADPSPQQRVRLMLAMADQLRPLGRDQESYDAYLRFVKQFPDYPEMLPVYKAMRELAEKLGKTDDEAKYRQEISRLTPPANPPR